MPDQSEIALRLGVPEGFAASTSRGPFTNHNGPTYRASAPGDMRSGLLVLERHCNSMGFLHGGMASAFADGALAWAVWQETRRMSVTMKLSLAFFDIVKAGQWLEARPVIDGVDDDIVHVHADLVSPQERAASRADGVFRLLRRKPGGGS